MADPVHKSAATKTEDPSRSAGNNDCNAAAPVGSSNITSCDSNEVTTCNVRSGASALVTASRAPAEPAVVTTTTTKDEETVEPTKSSGTIEPKEGEPTVPEKCANIGEKQYPESHPLNPRHPFYKKASDPKRSHRKWHRLEGYVMKCDVCENRAPGVLYQCDIVECEQRICINCARAHAHIQDGKLDPWHYIDPDEHDWTPRQRKKPAPKKGRGKRAARSPSTASVEPVQPQAPAQTRKRGNEPDPIDLNDDNNLEESEHRQKRSRHLPNSGSSRNPLPDAAPRADIDQATANSPREGNKSSNETSRERAIAAGIRAMDDEAASSNREKWERPEANVSSDLRGDQGFPQGVGQGDSNVYSNYHRDSQGYYDHRAQSNPHQEYHSHKAYGQEHGGPGSGYGYRVDHYGVHLPLRHRLVLAIFHQIFDTPANPTARPLQRPPTTIPELYELPLPEPHYQSCGFSQPFQNPTSAQRFAFRHQWHNDRTATEIGDEEVHGRITHAWDSNHFLLDERSAEGRASGRFSDGHLWTLQLLWEVFEVGRAAMASGGMDRTVRWFVRERDLLRTERDEAAWHRLHRPLPAHPRHFLPPGHSGPLHPRPGHSLPAPGAGGTPFPGQPARAPSKPSRGNLPGGGRGLGPGVNSGRR
ncbi:hypothetical protein QBC42DRAFT_329984 [Cladorrhinum samala]|uniref:Uncharacterized protein n=1 Tax=Cladorrhinum samala TaxID=585594 RepID=A0AAV9HKH6_9PEZI|nr:hypothetical protein QBC42DRAFT_329984 [Cladorrhinum samala]